MTRTAILTDLHANREALEAVLAHAAGERAERYALLGDFVGYGADPGWVVDRVRSLVGSGAVAVQGNHDQATVQGAAIGMRAEPRQVIEWTRSQLDVDQLDFLDRLPFAVAVGETLYVHANAWAPEEWEYITTRADAVMSLRATAQRITFCGHMHEPRLFRLSRHGKVTDRSPASGDTVALTAGHRWLSIPGSVGQPRDGDPAAAYALHDDAAATLTCWRVPYDHATAAAKIVAAGLPQALAERLAHGV